MTAFQPRHLPISVVPLHTSLSRVDGADQWRAAKPRLRKGGTYVEARISLGCDWNALGFARGSTGHNRRIEDHVRTILAKQGGEQQDNCDLAKWILRGQKKRFSD